MLSETRLHEKRENKRLHRMHLLKRRQVHITRFAKHNYGMREIVKLIEEQQGMLATIKKFVAQVVLVLKRLAGKRGLK